MYKFKIMGYNEIMKTITYCNENKITVDNEISAKEILEKFNLDVNTLAGIKINNEVCSLSQKIEFDANIEPVFFNSTEGAAIYRRSLCLLLATASHKLFPGKRLLVGHSLGYGYYYTIDSENKITNDDIENLKAQMFALVEKNIEITLKYVSYSQATELLDNLGLIETRKQLNYLCKSKILLNNLDDFSDIYFGPLVLTTGVLKTFDLIKYQDGFLLRFPSSKNPDKLTEFEDVPQLFNVYKKYKEWGKRLGVTSTASLNEIVSKRKTKEFIDITETLQAKQIADIADKIHERKSVKVVLIAGPSSSGKTTTSKKLSMQLKVLGYQPKVIELDTYYLNRGETPKDENGDYDYECLEALDVKQLNEDLVNLFAGKEVKLPSYNFTEGKRFYSGKVTKLEENDILIMEGIHGLNDKLTPLIPKEQKFKIYLSALTQLNLDDHNRIPTSDNRLIRRIVRDSQFRGKTAAETISMWPSVQRGEKLHIFPFQCKADVMLNTALDYELAVLKVYALPLLQCVTPLQKEYAEASRLISFLENFSPIPVTNVPGQSIIREFVGGSEFKY